MYSFKSNEKKLFLMFNNINIYLNNICDKHSFFNQSLANFKSINYKMPDFNQI